MKLTANILVEFKKPFEPSITFNRVYRIYIGDASDRINIFTETRKEPYVFPIESILCINIVE